MNRKREAVFMGIGILAGLALNGPAAQAAYLKATISSQPIYVDGQRVSMTAYSIGGNNYVRLRDIGKAVDFGVTYDAAANSVHIDSNQPYQEEIPDAPSGLTEESVQAALAQLKQAYPTGTVYGASIAPMIRSTGHSATATTVRAGQCCVPTPRSALCPGSGSPAQAGIRSAPAT